MAQDSALVAAILTAFWYHLGRGFRLSKWCK
jgi:hypothetical protein